MSAPEAPTMSGALRRAVFNSEDLRYLRRLHDEMLADLRERDGLMDGLGKDEIEIRLAAALFDSAKPGQRDDFRLKRQALEKVASLALDPR